MATLIDFFVRLRIDRRQYWIAMPMIFLAGAGGSTLTAWSYARTDRGVFWIAGLVVLSLAAVLGLWVLFRRMNDNTSPFLWFAGISVGGRLAQAAGRMVGGSRNDGDTALGIFFLVVLLALGLAPSKRAPSADLNVDLDEDDEASASAPL